MKFRKNFQKENEVSQKKLRKNEQIQSPFVNVVYEGSFLENVPISEAVEMAKERKLDLVEVDPNSNPPTCKIMDYGKYLYSQHKKVKKSQPVKIEEKCIRLTFGIALNDILVRVKRAEEFLKKGNKVRIELRFKGREFLNSQIGEEKFAIFLEELRKVMPDFQVTDELKMQGKMLFMKIEPNAKA